MNPTDFAVSRAIQELNELHGKGNYTASCIAEHLGCSRWTVMRSINRLLSDDKIMRSGKGKRGGYEYERSIFDYRSVS
jgi:predicted transcriptional regulator